jgi:hypothetical protein
MAGMLGAPVWASTQKKEVNAREEVQTRGNRDYNMTTCNIAL